MTKLVQDCQRCYILTFFSIQWLIYLTIISGCTLILFFIYVTLKKRFCHLYSISFIGQRHAQADPLAPSSSEPLHSTDKRVHASVFIGIEKYLSPGLFCVLQAAVEAKKRKTDNCGNVTNPRTSPSWFPEDSWSSTQSGQLGCSSL